jgi:acetate kinase
VVHGGPRHHEPTRIDDSLLVDLEAAVPLAPLHLPPSLEAIDVLARRLPGVPQVACFDTGFHHSMPESSWRLPVPRPLAELGVRRYGFHGLSYEYLVHALGAENLGRAALAHLGSGVSVAAVEAGRSVDTTMGLSPTGGLVMATRSGDLDPSVLVYLAREQGYSPERLEHMVNHESGLTGLGGGRGDMRGLLERRAGGDSAAALAVEVFVNRLCGQIAGYTTLLGGLDSLVFTGGIGSSADPVRAEICSGLDVLGVELDDDLNATHAPVISGPHSTVRVHVVTTNEEVVIARHTGAVLARARPQS